MKNFFDCEISFKDGQIALGQRLKLEEICSWIITYNTLEIDEILIFALEETYEI